MSLEDFDGAFELDSARAFDEDYVAGLKIFGEPLTGRVGVGQKDGGDSAQAGCGGEMLRVAAHAYDEIDSGIGGGLAAGGVEHRSVLAEFEHFARHEDATLGRSRGQRVNHGLQRFGVGVVAVVEDRSAGDFENFSALAAGCERFERGDGCIERTPASSATARPAIAFERVVRAEQMERECCRRARPARKCTCRPERSSLTSRTCGSAQGPTPK